MASVDGRAEGRQSEQGWPDLGYAWYVVIVLDAAALLSYIDRFIFGVLIEPIRRDLMLSDTQVSLIAGGAFALFFGFMALPLGWLADRVNRVRIIAFGVCAWSVLTALCGLSSSFWQLFVFRMGVGIAEAGLASSAYSLISDHFPPAKLPLAISAYVAAAMLGSGIGLIAGGWVFQLAMGAGTVTFPVVGALEPWQVSLVVVGLPGILVSLLVLTIREPRRRSRLDITAAGSVGAVSLRLVGAFIRGRLRFILLHHLGFSVVVMYAYSIFLWSPAFLSRTYGWSVSDAGTRFGAGVLLCGVSGTYLGGLVAQKLTARGMKDAVIRVAVYCLLLLVPLAATAPLMPSGRMALLALSAIVFLFSAASAVAPVSLQLVSPNEMRGQLSALFSFASVLIGLGGGPTLVALITDYIFHDPFALRYSLALVGGVTMAVASLLLGLCLMPYRHARECAERGTFFACA